MKPPKPLPDRSGSALAGCQNPGAIGPANLLQPVVQPGPLGSGAAPQTMPGALTDTPVTPPQAISKGRPLDSPETPAGARMSKRQASQGEDSPGETVGSGTPLLSLGRLGPPIWLGSGLGPNPFPSSTVRDPATQATPMTMPPPEPSRSEWLALLNEDSRFMRTLPHGSHAVPADLDCRTWADTLAPLVSGMKVVSTKLHVPSKHIA